MLGLKAVPKFDDSLTLSYARVAQRNNYRRLHFTLAASVNGDFWTFGSQADITSYAQGTIDYLGTKDALLITLRISS